MIRVGEVIAVHGTKITLRIEEISGKEVLFFGGDKYKGVSIREYLSIQRGFRDIICVVEGEHLDENRVEESAGKIGYVRKVEVRPIGYFEGADFKQGIKYMPMIKDPAFLLQEARIGHIFDRRSGSGFTIGKMLKEDISVSLPWTRVFNSHIGIFGNTGSGKSNTLTKLYSVLFAEKRNQIEGKSNFVILDFNGEYTGEQLVPRADKVVFSLNTQTGPATPRAVGSTFPIRETQFWDLETLSILFQATTNTQRPFLNRVVEGRARYQTNPGSLTAYAKKKIRDAFCAGQPRAATLDLMRSVARTIGAEQLINMLAEVSWHSSHTKFFMRGGTYFGPDGYEYDRVLAEVVGTLDASELDHFDQLILRVNLQLIADLINGYVQFEHIQPLLRRIEAALTRLRRVLHIGELDVPRALVSVISLRRCHNDIKKVLPLLLAKFYYEEHKSAVATPPDRTFHLVIDEAHNILSEQSARESETWKDYRLEQFEEIVKEGRKFGFFITIASQRPADISATIVSQLHNFFIHRLVNERDLQLIDNTITTLDSLSRGLIPSLAQGTCVVTGTAFELPMVLQIDRLPKGKQPDSEDVALERLWGENVE